MAAASAGHCLPSPPDVALEAVPRPGIYFGTTTAGSHLVQTGIAWGRAVDGADGLRHTCRHEHKLQDWGWREHNGADYGVEFIGDRELNLVSRPLPPRGKAILKLTSAAACRT